MKSSSSLSVSGVKRDVNEKTVLIRTSRRETGYFDIPEKLREERRKKPNMGCNTSKDSFQPAVDEAKEDSVKNGGEGIAFLVIS